MDPKEVTSQLQSQKMRIHELERALEVEEALEKVRARTMAMHQSDEMLDTAKKLFHQLEYLGIALDVCGFSILEKEIPRGKQFLSIRGTLFPEPLTFEFDKDDQLQKVYNAWVEQQPTMVLDIEGEELKQHMTNMKQLVKELSSVEVLVGTAEEIVKDDDPTGRLLVYHAFFNHGYLFLTNTQPVEEMGILVRFARVFEQTYTRFLDLKKAEEQTREAQIEAALERVRARTMAMQRSDELLEVAEFIFTEFQKVGKDPFDVSIFHLDHNLMTLNGWSAIPNGSSLSVFSYTLPPTDHPFIRTIFEQNLHQKPGEIYFLTGEEKVDYDDLFFQAVPIPEMETLFRGIESCYVNLIYNSNGGLAAITPAPLPEIDLTLLQRFSKVVDQSYTRFQDLKKAEKQAKEAQIEAALERVRSRTMAMHSSQELTAVMTTTLHQLQQLDFVIDQCGIDVPQLHSKDLYLWIATPQQKYVKEIHIPYFRHTLLWSINKHRKSGKKLLTLQMSKKVKDRYYHYVLEHSTLGELVNQERKAVILDARHWSVSMAFMDHSSLLIGNFEDHSYTAFELETLLRFAKVFDQAYTRFLDLQKAEAQVREAQIEASLERVRSASLAIHKSEELHKVVLTVLQEIKSLGLKIDAAHIYRFTEGDKGIHMWVAGDGGIYPYEVYFPYIKHEIFDGIYDARTTNKNFFTTPVVNKREFNRLYHHLIKSTKVQIPEDRQKFVLDAKSASYSVALGKHSGIGLLQFSEEESGFSREYNEILKRLSKVFEQAFTRFLDLQKAEAQAREAKIEAALQRVRAASMAMHSSEGLAYVAAVLREQLALLGQKQLESCLLQLYDKGSDTYTAYYTYKKPQITSEEFVQDRAIVPWKETAWSRTVIEKYLAGEVHFSIHADKEMLSEWYNMLARVSPLTVEKNDKGKLIVPEELFYDFAAFSGGFLSVVAYDEASIETKDLLDRAATTFDIAYRRYLDLKKAEAQAREAQIEVSLERVRAAAMAMHNSSELVSVSHTLREQLESLGVEQIDSVVIVTYDIAQNQMIGSYVYRNPENPRAPLQHGRAVHDWDATELSRLDKVKFMSADTDYTIKADNKMLREWHQYLAGTAPNSVEYDENGKLVVPKHLFYNYSKFRGGALVLITAEPADAESVYILKRAANVFDLAYQRFMDLQKAEAQTQEAQIEACLERIRAEAMAMHESKDLGKVVNVVFEELKRLDLGIMRCGIGLINGSNQTVQVWITSTTTHTEQALKISGDEPLSGHPLLEGIFNHWMSQKPFKYVLEGKDLIDYYRVVADTGFQEPLASDVLGAPQTKHFYYCVMFPAGGLFVFKDAPIAEETIQILHRFTDAFHLAYTRFEDLQKSEARTQAAIKEASLDRVRAEIASMRTAQDLERITPLVWRELTALGVPFFRCGVFIIREEEEMVHAYLSDPTGNSLAALHLRFDDTEIGLIGPSVENWRKQKVYREEWDQQHFIENMKRFMQRGHIESPEKYQAGDKPPEKLVLQLVPFKQGMLYAGNSEPLISEHVDLMQDLANAFSVAYARYEDFVQLEQAKQRVEKTLGELKSTQSQLVQAEKMASLGELTAGIAHEIQNPLNFVNNFSELNEELIDELKDELKKGNLEEALSIAEDLFQNEEKIKHHGKRAEGIVKSMLQHSRSGSGETELTDVNVLCGEYLRLAYHGFRAKDKSFKAIYKVVLDPDLPKVNVVPQDIGRVLLNLFNNAFHACAEQLALSISEESNLSNYKPLVSVSTKLSPSRGQGVDPLRGQATAGQSLNATDGVDSSGSTFIEITVSDNGPGIPPEIKDKIFQPFFTTKPTGQGTGLGLSLSYDIVKAHGGEIKVEPRENQGTKFTIILEKK